MIAAVCALRMDIAVVVEPDEASAKVLFTGTLIVASVVGIVLGLIICGTVSLLGVHEWHGGSLSWSALWLAAWLPQPTLQAWLIRHGRFGIAAASNAVTVAGSNLAQLGLAGLGYDQLGLIAGSAMAAIGGTVVAAAPILKNRDLGALDINEFRSLFVRHIRFLKYSVPFTILSLARERAAVLVLSAFGSLAQVGVYSQALRISSLPGGLAGAAIRPVIFHTISREGIRVAAPQISLLVRGLALTSAPWIGLFLYDPIFIFTALLGEKWSEAGLFGALMTAPAFAFLLTGWLDRAVDAVGRQDLNLKTQAIASLGSVGTFAAFLICFQNLFVATVAQSVVLSLAYILFLTTAFREFGLARWQLVKIFIAAVALATVPFGIAILIKGVAGPVSGLIAGGGVAAVTTGLVVIYLHRSVKRIAHTVAGG